mmetsp:Transcript_39454/g.111807  ORF Transcript_39454/g.111807 Transcript_39454/m.111807 type:complete len:273 (-) Transcript_39454:1025-1843(-)
MASAGQSMASNGGPANVLMIGAGEYTAGYVPTVAGAASDKPAGVVALSLFDLRRLGEVSRLVLCDICGTKLPKVRETLKRKIGDVYTDMDITVECFPSDDVQHDPSAYKQAVASMYPGDIAIVVTPDDTHAAIALEAVNHGLHVLLAKPAVKTLAEHRELMEAAARKGVLVSRALKCPPFHSSWRGEQGGSRKHARGSAEAMLNTLRDSDLHSLRAWLLILTAHHTPSTAYIDKGLPYPNRSLQEDSCCRTLGHNGLLCHGVGNRLSWQGTQ